MIIKTNFSNGLIYSWDGINNPLKYSNGYVSIKNTKKLISCTMSHGIRNYYIELKDKNNAWHINSSEKTWLLVQLNNFTGELQYITTTINPENKFGTTLPNQINIGEMFFNLTNNRMFQWNGYNWVNIIQIIVGTCQNGVVNISHTGTQVGSTKPSFCSTILQSRNGIPLRIQDGEYYSFMTQMDYKDNVNSWKTSTNILLSNSIYYGVASENIPHLSLLSIDNNGNIVKANNINKVAFAISMGNFSIGQVVKYITRGEIVDNSWIFGPDEINKNLFCDENGRLTTHLAKSNIIQKIGTIIGRDIIDFYPQEPIYLNPNF
jgi:hypothetical protein